MGQGVDEAQRQRELTKAALAGDLDRLEARVRAELDWRARLRRDAGRYIAFGVTAVAVVAAAGVVLVLRRRFARYPDVSESPATLEDIAAELRALRRDVEQVEKKNGTGSLVQKALLRGVTAAGSAGGAMLAKRMLQRQPGGLEGTESTRGG